MADEIQAAAEKKDDDAGEKIERWVGISVVALATFLGLGNVKDGNVVQAMQKSLVEKNDNWTWYQARNIREDVYQSTGDALSIPYPGETPEIKKAREALSAQYLKRAKVQAEKMEAQKQAALKADQDYDDFNNVDDQFDLSEAGLAVGLAMMGVTALIKRWWMFWIAMIPSTFGVFMGAAGFAGLDTSNPVMKALVKMLST